MKRKNPLTSKLAHDSVIDHKEAMYEKITKGLEKLKIGGTFEEIAEACNLEPEQVWKRLSEMVKAGTVFNVGNTRPSSKGRKCMVRQLVKFKIPGKGIQKELF